MGGSWTPRTWSSRASAAPFFALLAAAAAGLERFRSRSLSVRGAELVVVVIVVVQVVVRVVVVPASLFRGAPARIGRTRRSSRASASPGAARRRWRRPARARAPSESAVDAKVETRAADRGVRVSARLAMEGAFVGGGSYPAHAKKDAPATPGSPAAWPDPAGSSSAEIRRMGMRCSFRKGWSVNPLFPPILARCFLFRWRGTVFSGRSETRATSPFTARGGDGLEAARATEATASRARHVRREAANGEGGELGDGGPDHRD